MVTGEPAGELNDPGGCHVRDGGDPQGPAGPPLRLLALNPAVRGHNTNLAVAGPGVDELAGQADQALAT